MAINRITGMNSGLDTDKLIKDLMKAEQTRVDNVKRDKMALEWEQESYREITMLMTDFKSNYFDVLKPESNLTSETMFSQFTSSITSAGVDVDAVSVTGTSSTTNLDYTINSITQLATKDEYISVDAKLTSILSNSFNILSMPANFKVNMTIDGDTKTLEFDKATMITQDIDGFVVALQTEIGSKFGSDYADVVSKDLDDPTMVNFSKSGSSVSLLNYTGSETSLSFLGIESGASTSSYKTKSIGELLGVLEADLGLMTINSKSFSDLGITVDSTIDEVSTIINASSLDASFSYDQLSGGFEISSTKEGTVNKLDISTTFSDRFKFTGGTYNDAKNALLEINGEQVVKSTNTFTLDGMTYSLKSTHTTGDIDVKLSRDTEKVADKLKSFVEEYNKIIETINDKIDEKTYRNYKPLTDEEREELSDDEIETWEAKAKSGILKNDPILSNMLSSMRSALYGSVEGSGVALYQIGITTTSNYTDNGKLIINETKLKESLENDYESVVKLFTSESDKSYLDLDNRSERYRENGLGNRLKDIINDAVRITRGSSNQKGSLIEKAGLPGDTSTVSNLIAKEIARYDTRINVLLDYLTEKETNYYNKFARMEKALGELEGQSSSLASVMGY